MDTQITGQSGEVHAGPAGTHHFLDGVKTAIADKLHDVADVLEEKSLEYDPLSDVALYERRASIYLDRWANDIRCFDFTEADAKARLAIRQNPGRSLLIAAAAGMLLRALLRRS